MTRRRERAIGSNPLEAAAMPVAAAPADPEPAQEEGSGTRVHVILHDRHLDTVAAVEVDSRAATRKKLDRTKQARALWSFLAAVRSRIDWRTVRTEEDLTRALLALLRPR